MEDHLTNVQQLLFLLDQTPKRIASVSARRAVEKLYFKSSEADWSANDILAHLRACADVWGKHIVIMLMQDHPTLRYISPRAWIRKTNYPTLEFHASLEAFTQQWNELLQTLNKLEMKDWLRGATYTGTTRGGEQTIWSRAQQMVQHEIEHCEQIEKLLEQS